MRITLATITLLATLFSANTLAAGSWKVSQKDGEAIAITPTHGMILKMRKPNKGLWGKLYVNLTEEQVEGLKKHRLDKYFSFIAVGVEVDRYTRNTNAKVIESKQYVRIDIDERMWDSLKKGDELTIYLPDGSTYVEKLRGSSKALRYLEKRLFSKMRQ